MEWHAIQGGVEIPLVASYYRNWGKERFGLVGHLSHMFRYLGACFLNILSEIRLSRRTFPKCKLLLWNMISRPSDVKSRGSAGAVLMEYSHLVTQGYRMALTFCGL